MVSSGYLLIQNNIVPCNFAKGKFWTVHVFFIVNIRNVVKF